MARSKSAFQIRIEYYPIRAFTLVIECLPFPWAARLARIILKGVLACIPKRRALALANLQHSFPSHSLSQNRRIFEQSIDSLARLMALYPRIPDLAKQGMESWATIEGLEHVEAAFAQGHGAIAFTAHYANWELIPVVASQHYGSRVAIVGRPLDNPWLDQYCNSIRSCTGTQVIGHRHAIKEGLRVLRHNGILGILIDQNASRGDIFVDFLGRPASTTPIASFLARRTGAAVIPLHNRWDGTRFHIIFDPPLVLSKNPQAEEAIREDTQQMTNVIEDWVRQDPGQWFWLHHRWKRQPDAGEAEKIPAVKSRD